MKCPLHSDQGAAQPLLFTLLVLMFFCWGGPPASSLTLIVHHIASQSVTCSRSDGFTALVCHELCHIELYGRVLVGCVFSSCSGPVTEAAEGQMSPEMMPSGVEVACCVCFICRLAFILVYFSSAAQSPHMPL